MTFITCHHYEDALEIKSMFHTFLKQSFQLDNYNLRFVETLFENKDPRRLTKWRYKLLIDIPQSGILFLQSHNETH